MGRNKAEWRGRRPIPPYLRLHEQLLGAVPQCSRLEC
jgi:hypothetical protein